MRSAVIKGTRAILRGDSVRSTSVLKRTADVTYHYAGWKERGNNMFIKEQVFKKIAKQAWRKSSLVVAHAQGVYHIEMGPVMMQVKAGLMSNKTKAALVELIGELPAEGEGYKYGEDADPQILGLFENLGCAAGDECCETCVMIRNGHLLYNVYQTDDAKVKVLNSLVSLVDESQVDAEAGECKPGNPVLSAGNITWENNVMALRVPVSEMKYPADKIILSIREDLTFDGIPLD